MAFVIQNHDQAGGFYRTFGQAFDQAKLEAGQFYFDGVGKYCDHFDTRTQAEFVMNKLMAMRPEYKLTIEERA